MMKYYSTVKCVHKSKKDEYMKKQGKKPNELCNFFSKVFSFHLGVFTHLIMTIMNLCQIQLKRRKNTSYK